ncbi:MAG: hypothetical protein ACKVY0_07930 [Prosthecobacter sp.]|uniref:hypothetical protein n=1 Tax=Prosthecobacter sp. TaxID=1965333 RepID=UPI00390032B7
MPTPETSPAKSRWWLEPLIWTVCFAIAISVAAYVNETAREIVMQGLAYLFAFLTTPFVLEASAAFIGLCIVFVINTRRIEREGDGWVEMEVQQPAPAADQDATKPETVV